MNCWSPAPSQPLLAGQLAAKCGISPLLARRLLNRGFSEPSAIGIFLRPRLQNLADPFLLPDMDAAVGRLLRAREQNESLVIFGDSRRCLRLRTDAPRFMTVGPDGALLVTERGSGNIVALRDPNHSGKATEKTVIASGLDQPTSVDYVDGKLYVGETSRVTRFSFDSALKASDKTALITDLPHSGEHITRTVLIGPDGKLYVSIGSSCNVCDETDPHRAAVWVYNPDGSGGHRFAYGLRNAVGMAVNPITREIWVTNMGRDLLGDNIPPDTIYSLRAGAELWLATVPRGQHHRSRYGQSQATVTASTKLAGADSGPFRAVRAGLLLSFGVSSQLSWSVRRLSRLVESQRADRLQSRLLSRSMDQGHVAGPPRDFATGWLA